MNGSRRSHQHATGRTRDRGKRFQITKSPSERAAKFYILHGSLLEAASPFYLQRASPRGLRSPYLKNNKKRRGGYSPALRLLKFSPECRPKTGRLINLMGSGKRDLVNFSGVGTVRVPTVSQKEQEGLAAFAAQQRGKGMLSGVL